MQYTVYRIQYIVCNIQYTVCSESLFNIPFAADTIGTNNLVLYGEVSLTRVSGIFSVYIVLHSIFSVYIVLHDQAVEHNLAYVFRAVHWQEML